MKVDALILSRLQFAAATFFHFLFVPLTLGLSILVAVIETKYARTGDNLYLRMTKFWGKIFLINFAIGIVTGITLEFQFGTNWSRYSAFVGDIFGSLLAIEATAAFFLESTLKKGPCCGHVAYSRCVNLICCMDTNCQLLDATPGGICLKKRQGRIERLCRRGIPAVGYP